MKKKVEDPQKSIKFKALLLAHFDNIKDAADYFEVSEQQLHSICRAEARITLKYLEKLSKKIKMSVSEIYEKLESKENTNYNINTNTVTNTVNEPNAGYKDELEKLRKELSETKDKLLKCNEELIQFYKKNI